MFQSLLSNIFQHHLYNVLLSIAIDSGTQIRIKSDPLVIDAEPLRRRGLILHLFIGGPLNVILVEIVIVEGGLLQAILRVHSLLGAADALNHLVIIRGIAFGRHPHRLRVPLRPWSGR